MRRLSLMAAFLTALLLTNTPTASAQTKAAVVDSTDVVFRVVDVDFVVTCIDVSDDGRFLAIAHEGDGRVSIYDVIQKEVVHSIETPSPRTVIWRGDSIIVANEVDGELTVYSDAPSWEQTATIRMPRPGLKHVAAPRGKAFRNVVLVTCHGPGTSASYQDSAIYAVNIRTKQLGEISKSSLGLISYDGRLLMLPESFNLSSSGTVSAFSYAEYISNRGKARKLYTGGSRDAGYIYQVSPGGYWFSHKVVLGGAPLRQIGEPMPNLIFADMSQKLVYSLDKNTLTAHRLKSSIEPISARRVQFPSQFRDDAKLFDNWGHRSYLLDHPVAVTHSDQLFLFFRPAKGGVLLAADVEAFEPVRSTRTARDRMRSGRSKPSISETAARKPREWNSRTGKFSVEAFVGSANESEVELHRADGIKITVPLSQLSDTDRAYVKKWLDEQKEPEETNPFAVPGEQK